MVAETIGLASPLVPHSARCCVGGAEVLNPLCEVSVRRACWRLVSERTPEQVARHENVLQGQMDSFVDQIRKILGG
jgi:hypothetical protein